MRCFKKSFFLFVLFCLQVILGDGQTSGPVHDIISTRTTNSCGVKAIINPGGDSIVTSYTAVLFSSASINATSYKFIIDRVQFSPNSPINFGIPIGITEVKLVAYNGSCTDTATAYYFYAGDFPPDTNNTKIYYGRPATNEYLANFIPVSTGGFLIAGDRNNNSYLNLPQRGFLIKTKT